MFVLLFPGLFVIFLNECSCLHLTGEWSSNEFMQVLTKFGFQQTDPLKLEETRGYIYGNITSIVNWKAFNRVLLVLSNRASFGDIFGLKGAPPSDETCRLMLDAISNKAYHPKCNPKGQQDYFRWVPCPEGKLCPDEDKPENVVSGSQFTYRTQDEFSPGFWYLSLIACQLNAHCNWTLVKENVQVKYDLWLVNGPPGGIGKSKRNPMEHQFSFDEQDTVEIHALALLLFNALLLLQFRATRLVSPNPGQTSASVAVPLRVVLLGTICVLKTVSVLVTCMHVVVFAFNGQGVNFLQWIGDFGWIITESLITLLLILLARGWCILDTKITRFRLIISLWSSLLAIRIILFIWNYQAVDKLEEIDIFETVPGYGILVIRVLFMVWFIMELRNTVTCNISSIVDDATVSFVVHFGAGFMVWFFYQPALGLIASQISLLWRFKIILGVSYMADLLCLLVLIHLFWPNSTNRQFFIDESGFRRTRQISEDYLEDYERALVLEDEDSVPFDPHILGLTKL